MCSVSTQILPTYIIASTYIDGVVLLKSTGELR